MKTKINMESKSPNCTYLEYSRWLWEFRLFIKREWPMAFSNQSLRYTMTYWLMWDNQKLYTIQYTTKLIQFPISLHIIKETEAMSLPSFSKLKPIIMMYCYTKNMLSTTKFSVYWSKSWWIMSVTFILWLFDMEAGMATYFIV